MHKPILAPKIFVFTSKVAFMQRISDYVRTGHVRYIRGRTAPGSIFATFDRLAGTHPVYFDKLKASRARAAGEPTARLLIWLPEVTKEAKFEWILLAQGEGLSQAEKWLDATDSGGRIRLTGYELVRITKEGQAKPSWSWRYEPIRFQELRDSLVGAIRSRRDQDAKRMIDLVARTVGFGGSRAQAKAILELAKVEWQRRRPNDPMPEFPKGIGWTRRKSDVGVFINRPKGTPTKKKDRPIDLSLFPQFNLDAIDEALSYKDPSIEGPQGGPEIRPFGARPPRPAAA